tara:strand:- start:722 stop:1000 length:279 start_codon:yes stop_codon:yes gene_type:complete
MSLLINMDINKLKIPKDYVVEREAVYNGYQMIVRFPNGYAASLVNHDHSYGLELAVLDSDNKITYDTHITDDVIGHLTEDAALDLVTQISKL